MDTLELVLGVSCMVVVAGAMWRMVTLPAFSEALTAWAKRHNEEAQRELMLAWADGHQAGQEFERLKGSRSETNT